MAIVLSLISLTTVWFGFAWAKRASGTEAAIVAAGACAIWYELVYFAPKTLTEVVATHALLPGLYLGMYGERLGEKKRMFLAGILCWARHVTANPAGSGGGLRGSLFLLPQLAKADAPSRRGASLAGGCFRLGRCSYLVTSLPIISCLLPQCMPSEFSVPSLPDTDVAEGAHNVATWYWYLRMLCAHLGPVAFLVLMGIRRSPFLGWVALVHLVFHSLFGFWEVRYLYPLMPLEITLAALGLMELAPVFNARRRSPLSPRTIVVGGLAFLALCSCLLVSQFDWSRRSGCLVAFDQLSRDSTLCGVGVYRYGVVESWRLCAFASKCSDRSSWESIRTTGASGEF